MGRILITPEEVDQVANQFQQGGNQTQELVGRLNQQVQSMQSQWDGMTSQRFFAQFQEAHHQLNNAVQLMDQIGQELRAIAERFRQVDQAAL